MATVFVSGSRKLSRLNPEIQERLSNIIEKGFSVIVGDANGADKALQTFFADCQYENVTVYCSGGICRNNVGQWEEYSVQVDSRLKGRDFYTAKDRVMATHADYGLVLWDGQSAGSVSNIFELVKQEKPVVVYFSPTKEIFQLKTIEDAETLLGKCQQTDVQVIFRKTDIGLSLGSRQDQQMTLAL